jgi:hypothetical protein
MDIHKNEKLSFIVLGMQNLNVSGELCGKVESTTKRLASRISGENFKRSCANLRILRALFYFSRSLEIY